MALLSSLVAKLETPTKDDKKSIGTAYPIAPGYIITAYHVFPHVDHSGKIDYSKTEVIWQRNDDAREGEENAVRRPEPVPVTNILYESASFDLVIASCDTPEGVVSVQWCRDFSELNGEWSSHGYAATGKNPERKVRLKDPAGGTFFDPQDDDWIQQLESKGNATRVELWRGMSGASVFSKGTDRVACVITETPRKDNNGEPVRDEVLYAISIPYLFQKDNEDCKRFRSALEQIAVEAGVSEQLTQVEGILNHGEGKLLRLVRSHCGFDSQKDAKSVATEFSQYPVRQFLRLIAALQEKHANHAYQFGELLCTLMPTLFNSAKVVEVRDSLDSEKGCYCIKIPHATDPPVEMLMAQVDKRAAAIEICTGKNFKAVYKQHLPPENAGDERCLEDDIKADAEGFYAGEQYKLLLARTSRSLHDKVVFSGLTGDESPDAEDCLGYVQDALCDRYEEHEPSYYFVVDQKIAGGEESVQQLASSLGKYYPHCAVLQVNNDRRTRRNETSDFRPLVKIMECYLQPEKD